MNKEIRMAKNYEGTQLKNIIMRIVIPHTVTEVDAEPEYYAGLLKSQAIVADDTGRTVSTVYNDVTLGTAKQQEWTKKEIYDYINGLCAPLAVKLKKLYEDGIDVDPSI